jgi:tellurite methyltransferase
MAKRNDWLSFYEKTKENPPSELLIKALVYVNHKKKAIDIGGGALKDSRLLLKEGFEVMDLDSQALSSEMVGGLNPKKFHQIISTFEDFDFTKNEYDLASAMYALPFNPPNTFDEVFERIKQSLRMNGIFCGNLFGIRDEWAGNTEMTFHTLKQAKRLLSDMEIISFEERERDGKIASGKKKHWHTFEFIAKRIS